MSETQALFTVLQQSADAACVAAIERLVRDAPDRKLSRINVLDFARREGLDEEQAIAAFLHAAQIGLFDMSWNVLCPSCSGVLDANASLKSVRSGEYYCAFCNLNNEPALDDTVEVSFTVSPRVRRIAAHDPHSLPPWEYFRQAFWSSGIDLPETGLEDILDEITIDSLELAPGEIEHVDATEAAIRSVPDQPFERAHAIGVGRLLQDCKQGVRFAHGRRLRPKMGRRYAGSRAWMT